MEKRGLSAGNSILILLIEKISLFLQGFIESTQKCTDETER